MSEIVFPSTKAGNEVDRAVTAALQTIPGQVTQLDTRVTALENDVDDLQTLPAQVATIGSKIGDLANLQTTEKSNLVGAINEVKSAANTNATNVSSIQGQVGSKSASSRIESSTLWAAVDEVMENAGAGGTGAIYAELNKTYSMLDGVGIVEDVTINADGTEKSWNPSLSYCHTDYIPVYANVTYVCFCYGIAFYDSNKNFVESTTISNQFREYTPPQDGYIIVSSATGVFTINRLCRKEDMYLSRWDMLGERNPWSDPKRLCAVEMYGDSNTVGYGLSDTSKSWGNRIGASILSLPEYQYCGRNEFSCFCHDAYSYNPKLFNNGGIVFFTAYTDEMVVEFDYLGSVAVEIDGVAKENITASSTTYTLELGMHTIKLQGISGQNVLKHIRIHKVRTFVNNAVTGTGTSTLNGKTPPTNGIAIIMYGTNDRATEYGATATSYYNFLYKALLANCKVYVFTPIPMRVAAETASASFVRNIRDVITELPNVHLIDVYKDMMLFSMLSSASIYNDDLHINDLGHKVLYVIAASKLQLAALKSEIE